MRPDLHRTAGRSDAPAADRDGYRCAQRPPAINGQRGFGLVAALFLIIVIAGVVAAMARMAVSQSATISLALQQARAYQAARAGLDWGISRAVASDTPMCESLSFFQVDGYSIRVECAQTSALDGGRTVTFYALISTAEYSVLGNPDYSFRKVNAVVER